MPPLPGGRDPLMTEDPWTRKPQVHRTDTGTAETTHGMADVVPRPHGPPPAPPGAQQSPLPLQPLQQSFF